MESLFHTARQPCRVRTDSCSQPWDRMKCSPGSASWFDMQDDTTGTLGLAEVPSDHYSRAAQEGKKKEYTLKLICVPIQGRREAEVGLSWNILHFMLKANTHSTPNTRNRATCPTCYKSIRINVYKIVFPILKAISFYSFKFYGCWSGGHVWLQMVIIAVSFPLSCSLS